MPASRGDHSVNAGDEKRRDSDESLTDRKDEPRQSKTLEHAERRRITCIRRPRSLSSALDRCDDIDLMTRIEKWVADLNAADLNALASLRI